MKKMQWGGVGGCLHVSWVALICLGSMICSPIHGQDPRAGLRISELMYQPPEGDAYEFLELENVSTVPVDLSGFKLDGVKLTFNKGVQLGGRSIGVVISDANPAAFTNRFPGANMLAVYTGRLSNQGERIALMDADGRTIVSVTYGVDGFWPLAAAGKGASLEFSGGQGDPSDPSLWLPSSTAGGTPGRAFAGAAGSIIKLSRIYAAGDASSVGGDGTDFVELLNPGGNDVDLGGWSLTDQKSDLRRYILPAGSLLKAGAALMIFFDRQTNSPGFHAPFGLDSSGGYLFVFDSRTNRVDGVAYGPQTRGLALQRIGDGWSFVRNPIPSTGGNLPEFAPPAGLIINEWNTDSSTAVADWFEIYNPDPVRPVLLTGLSFTNSNAWVAQRWPSVVGAGDWVRVWADESGLPGHADLKLPASDATLSLLNTNGIVIQQIRYGAQIEGATEGRLPDGSTNIVKFAGAGTPGRSNILDSDGDGLPDAWELENGFDAANAGDALLDQDQDGLSNREEYVGGTNPRDASSVLRLEVGIGSGGNPELVFLAAENRTYSLIWRDRAEAGKWVKLADFSGGGSNRVVRTDIPEIIRSRGTAAYFKLTSPIVVLADESFLLAANPPFGSTNQSSAGKIQIQLRQAIDPASISARGFALETEQGEIVPGELRFSSDFTAVSFQSDLPLLASTAYRVRLGDGLKMRDGSLLKLPGDWIFTTSPAAFLIENKAVYSGDSPDINLVSVQPVLRPGGYTMEDVDADDSSTDGFDPKVEVIWSDGFFGAGVTQPNGTIEQRGQSTRLSSQKSYKIRLGRGVVPWRSMKIMNLNKHPYDLTRLRNKLGMDLLSGVPHMGSLRTLFARMALGGSDLGLFTIVEEPDGDYLKAHGFDAKGHLYKPRMFEFYRYPDELRLESDPLYDSAAFSSVLESKAASGNGKLLRMLDDLNNDAIPVEQVMAQHFEINNYVNWLASSILLDNEDTTSQNFLLYSPSDSSSWYFLPWDYDGAFGFYSQPDQLAANAARPRWTEGVANWWGAVLHRRFLSSSNHVSLLNAAINRLGDESLSSARLASRLATYRDLVRKEVFLPPDEGSLPVHFAGASEPQAAWDAECQRVAGITELRRREYFATLSRPMPFFQGRPELGAQGWEFYWEASFQLQGRKLVYDFELSRTPGFAAGSVVKQVSSLSEPGYVMAEKLEKGRYYFRVIARCVDNPEVDWQNSFDTLFEGEPVKAFRGVTAFDVP